MVINGGIGEIVPSTVVDCTDEEPEIIRQGQGELIIRD
jgi:tRNA A37 threonylcarbamoyladenosine synthetase subunit TsaC/SUA5/YrdC